MPTPRKNNKGTGNPRVWRDHHEQQLHLTITLLHSHSLHFMMVRDAFSRAGMSMSTTPLSEIAPTSLNSATAIQTLTSQQNNNFAIHDDNENMESQSPPSSPFVANISDNIEDSENITRLSAKSPISREQASPLKLLKSRTSPTPSQTPQRADSLRSPRKISSPDKRFPIRVSSPAETRPAAVEISIDDVLRDNEGLTKAIQILEDEDSELNGDQSMDDTFVGLQGSVDADETANIDDTMVSTFSDFSAVPDMTSFAKLGQTPTKYSGPTPRRTLIETPATARRPASVIQSRTFESTPRPRYGTTRDDTNLILDFTDQINGFSGYSHPSPVRTARNSPLKSTPDMSWATTPTVNRNNMSNLLDFDIPPAPTPRSMPSITPRELESLKSAFLSEISSLKASLSGKEAEVNSLKTAVGDAEKRVGESAEQVREEQSLKEQLLFEKEEWEKRGREMEAVLRNVKEEIVHGERERDELEGRLAECEGRREAAEMMAQEAQSKMAAMRAGKVSPLSESTSSETNKSGDCNNCGGKAVEVAVEKVSRELHTLYKEKHESKVAALKKSYEKRWEKRIRELEYQIEDLGKENDELRIGRDNTMTKVEPRNPLEVTMDLEKQAARDAKTKELEAELEGLNKVIDSINFDNSDLRRMLDEERVEKGKLVAAVDEMIPLVAAFDDMLANMDSVPGNAPSATNNHQPTSQPSQVENLRGSISRASGLRAPASVKKNPPMESRIGRGGFGAPAGHERTKSVISQGTSRPGSGLGSTSRSGGIMSSIEKMGSYKGRGGE